MLVPGAPGPYRKVHRPTRPARIAQVGAPDRAHFAPETAPTTGDLSNRRQHRQRAEPSAEPSSPLQPYEQEFADSGLCARITDIIV